MNIQNVKFTSDIVAAFKEKFHSEDVCRKAMFSNRWPNGFCCPHCGHEKYYLVTTRNLYECKDCRSQTSLTAGTMMHNTKLPLQFWFLVIHLSSEGIIFSARWLSKTLQVNYRTAHRMLHAVRRSMRSQNGYHFLTSYIKSTTSNPETNSKSNCDNNLDPEDQEVIQRVKRIMLKKINQFIRTVYRSVHRDFKQNYIDEFYFQWKNRIGKRDHIFPAMMGACTVLWS